MVIGEGSDLDKCGSMNYVDAKTAVLHLDDCCLYDFPLLYIVRLIKIVSFIFVKVVAFLIICFAYLSMIIT